MQEFLSHPKVPWRESSPVDVDLVFQGLKVVEKVGALLKLEDRLLVLRDRADELDKKFNPDQPRDTQGRWSSSGGGVPKLRGFLGAYDSSNVSPERADYDRRQRLKVTDPAAYEAEIQSILQARAKAVAALTEGEVGTTWQERKLKRDREFDAALPTDVKHATRKEWGVRWGGEVIENIAEFSGDVPYHPKYVYHGTSSVAYEKIKHEGLTPFEQELWIVTDPSSAFYEALRQAKGDLAGIDKPYGDGGEPVVFAIKRSDLAGYEFVRERSAVYADPSESGLAAVTNRAIPSRMLNVISEDEVLQHANQMLNPTKTSKEEKARLRGKSLTQGLREEFERQLRDTDFDKAFNPNQARDLVGRWSGSGVGSAGRTLKALAAAVNNALQTTIMRGGLIADGARVLDKDTVLFHGTSSQALARILKSGLDPKAGGKAGGEAGIKNIGMSGELHRKIKDACVGHVFTTTNEIEAVTYAYQASRAKDYAAKPVVLKLQVPKGETSHLDVMTGLPSTHKFKHRIKPEWIVGVSAPIIPPKKPTLTDALGGVPFERYAEQARQGLKYREVPVGLRKVDVETRYVVILFAPVPIGDIDEIDKAFNPNQARDEHGRWVDEGGASIIRVPSPPWKVPKERVLPSGRIVPTKSKGPPKAYSVDVGAIASKYGVDHNIIRVYQGEPRYVRTGQKGKSKFRIIGKYDIRSGLIEIDPEAVAVSGRKLSEFLAHEMTHKRAMDYFKTKEGVDYYKDKLLDLANDTKSQDVTLYSNSFWTRVWDNKDKNWDTPEKQEKAKREFLSNKSFYLSVHETLAEMSGVLERTGKLPGGQAFKDLYDRVFADQARVTKLEDRMLILRDKIDVLQKDFDPNQPRDVIGRWTDTGGGGSQSWLAAVAKAPFEHRHTTKAIAEVGKKYGVDPDSVSISYLSASPKVAGFGVAAGTYHPEHKNITIWPLAIKTTGTHLKGVIAHEMTHKRAYDYFDSPAGKRWVANTENLVSLSKETQSHGITPYAKSYWSKLGTTGWFASSGLKQDKLLNAVHETLAEMSAVHERTGRLSGGKGFRALYKKVFGHSEHSLHKLEDRILILRDKIDNAVLKFDPDQARDNDGKWTDSGGGAPSAKANETSRWKTWAIAAGTTALAAGAIAAGSYEARRRVLKNIATMGAKYGVNPSSVSIKWIPEKVQSQIGKLWALGGYNVQEKKITVYPVMNTLFSSEGAIRPSFKRLGMTLAHEMTHARAFSYFETPAAEKYFIENVDALVQEGLRSPVSKYAAKYWENVKYLKDPSTIRTRQQEMLATFLAVNEQLAEMSAIKESTGKLPGGVAHRILYKRIMGHK